MATLTIEELQPMSDRSKHAAYAVVFGRNRVLSICTGDNDTAAKWVKETLKLKTCQPTGKKEEGSLIVGVALGRRNATLDGPCDIMQLCTGLHCLLYLLPTPEVRGDKRKKGLPKFFGDFFTHPKVTAVMMDMKAVTEKLGRDYGLEFCKAEDLNVLSVTKIDKPDFNLQSLDLYALSGMIMGPEMYLRPHDVNGMEETDRYKVATADAFLSFALGFRLLTKRVDAYSVEGWRLVKLNKKQWKKHWSNRFPGIMGEGGYRAGGGATGAGGFTAGSLAAASARGVMGSVMIICWGPNNDG